MFLVLFPFSTHNIERRTKTVSSSIIFFFIRSFHAWTRKKYTFLLLLTLLPLTMMLHDKFSQGFTVGMMQRAARRKNLATAALPSSSYSLQYFFWNMCARANRESDALSFSVFWLAQMQFMRRRGINSSSLWL